MKLAYADPPYPGCAHLYKDHPDYAGEVDHHELVARLEYGYDGYVLHTSSPALESVKKMCGPKARTHIWTKTFAAFRRNVPVAYAWEPVIVKPVRKPVVSGRCVMRDWFGCPITMKRGLTGAKPEALVHYLMEVAGMSPDDDLVDLYPGTGAVTRAWESWKAKVRNEN